MSRHGSSEPLNIELSAISYREGRWAIAHCLELDLAAEGQTGERALFDLVDLIDAHIGEALQTGDLQAILNPAPREIWMLFSLGKPVAASHVPARPVGRFAARELPLG